MNARIRFFVVDLHGRVHKLTQTGFHAVWDGKRPVLELGLALGDWLPVVTVLVDKHGEPAYLHMLKLPVENGFLADEALYAAAMTCVDAKEYLEAEARYQRRRENDVPPKRPEPSELLQAAFQGWPDDLRQQLATALDVPVADLPEIILGGPLALSVQMDRTIKGQVDDMAYRLFCSNCGKAAAGSKHWPPLCERCGGKNEQE